jgi:hypothetical protein
VYACFQFTVTVVFGGRHKLIIARHPLFPLLETSTEKMGESVLLLSFATPHGGEKCAIFLT